MKKALIAVTLALVLSPLSAPAFDEEEERHYRAAAEFLEMLGMEKRAEETVAAAVAEYLKGNPRPAGQVDLVRTFYGKYLGWAALENEMADLLTAEFSEKEIGRMMEAARTEAGRETPLPVLDLYREGVSMGKARALEHMKELEAILPDP